MTPEERARKILKTEIKFKEKISPIGHFRRDLLAQAVESAIREAEAAVHAQYQEVLKAAVESSTTAAYLAARANLKGK